jgi:hypothetical protein
VAAPHRGRREAKAIWAFLQEGYGTTATLQYCADGIVVLPEVEVSEPQLEEERGVRSEE